MIGPDGEKPGPAPVLRAGPEVTIKTSLLINKLPAREHPVVLIQMIVSLS